jgi:hypothetical protein
MIAIAMDPPLEPGGGAKKANPPEASVVEPIAELNGGDSTVKNVTMGGAGRQRIKKAAADGEEKA